MNTIRMLSKTPEFDLNFVAYVKNDPAREPVAISYSPADAIREASDKSGRAKSDFELRQISRYE